MMKDTALVELPGSAVAQTRSCSCVRRSRSAATSRNRLESLLVAAALYWLLTSIFTFFQSRLERRISKGYVRTEVQTATGRKRTQFLTEWLPVGGRAAARDRWRSRFPTRRTGS